MNTSLRPIRILNSEGGDGERVLTIVSASSIAFITHAQDTFEPKIQCMCFQIELYDVIVN